MKVARLILDLTLYHQSVSVHMYICDCDSIYTYTHSCSAYASYINSINFCLKQYLVIELLTRCKYYSALSHAIYYNYISFFKHISVDPRGNNYLSYHLPHFLHLYQYLAQNTSRKV